MSFWRGNHSETNCHPLWEHKIPKFKFFVSLMIWKHKNHLGISGTTGFVPVERIKVRDKKMIDWDWYHPFWTLFFWYVLGGGLVLAKLTSPGMVWHRDTLPRLAAVLTLRGGIQLTQCAACVVTFGDVALLGSSVLNSASSRWVGSSNRRAQAAYNGQKAPETKHGWVLRGLKDSDHPHPARPQMHTISDT